MARMHLDVLTYRIWRQVLRKTGSARKYEYECWTSDWEDELNLYTSISYCGRNVFYHSWKRRPKTLNHSFVQDNSSSHTPVMEPLFLMSPPVTNLHLEGTLGKKWNFDFRHLFCHSAAKSWLASCKCWRKAVSSENHCLTQRHW